MNRMLRATVLVVIGAVAALVVAFALSGALRRDVIATTSSRASFSGARWTDHDTIDVDEASIAPRRVLWSPGVPLGETDAARPQRDDDRYEPCHSPDGTTIVFVRGRPGEGADLHETRWTPAGWSAPRPLTAINTSVDELGPAFAPDGRTLYFHSDREGGLGGYDLWRSRLESMEDGDERWSTPINLGPVVNTRFNEYGAAPTPDGRALYFSSNRPRDEEPAVAGDDAWRATLRERRTRRDYDLFAAPAVDGEFLEPQRLAINTPHDEGAPAVSPAGDFLWFASDRPGGSGGFDLHRCRVLPGGEGDALPSLGGVERLDDAINSRFDELDPTLGAEGFRLVFSSDRPVEGALDQEDASRQFTLWTSVSREVELEPEPWPSLASLIHTIWPWLLALLLLLSLLLLLIHLLRSTEWRARIARMSLFAQCLLASLAVHALLAFLLGLWQVGLGIGEFIRGGSGSQVLLASTGTGSTILDQLFASPVTIDAEREIAPLAPLAAIGDSSEFAVAQVPLPSVEDAPTGSAPHVPGLRELALDSIPVIAALPPTPEPSADRVVDVPTRLELVHLDAGDQESVDRIATAMLPAAPMHEPHPGDVLEIATRLEAGTSASLELSAPSVSPPRFQDEVRPDAAASTTFELTALPQLPLPEAASSPTPTMPPLVETSDLDRARASNERTEILPAAFATRADTGMTIPAPPPMPRADDADAPRSAPRIEPTLAHAPPMLPALRDVAHDVAAATAIAMPALPEIVRSPGTASAGGAAPMIASVDLPDGPPEPLASFAHRAPEQRAQLLVATGGSEESEAAVARALEYFERHQSPDGRWSAKGFSDHGRRVPAGDHAAHDAHAAGPDTGSGRDLAPCDCDAPAEVAMDVATTGLVLLCYLGAGHTHQPLPNDLEHSGAGLFRASVSAGIRWLVDGQTPEGDLRRRGLEPGPRAGPRADRRADPQRSNADTIYGHTIATVALCEAYAMTRDPALVEPVRRAHAFLEQWSTAARRGRDAIAPEDTSVLGWEIMALASARRAGLPVRAASITSARRWLDEVAMDGARGRYGYRKGDRASVAMTAEALFVRQLLVELDGGAPDEPREAQSSAFIVESLPEGPDMPNGADGSLSHPLSHHWYYATLALHRRQGDDWRRWNSTLAPLLIAGQRQDGCAAGSWDPHDPWSRLGGRLYQTAICTLSLEVYYRYEARR